MESLDVAVVMNLNLVPVIEYGAVHYQIVMPLDGQFICQAFARLTRVPETTAFHRFLCVRKTWCEVLMMNLPLLSQSSAPRLCDLKVVPSFLQQRHKAWTRRVNLLAHAYQSARPLPQ